MRSAHTASSAVMRRLPRGGALRGRRPLLRPTARSFGGRQLPDQLPAGDRLQIPVIDRFTIRAREVERVENLQGQARIHRPALGVERAIGGEYDLVARKELQAAFRRGDAAEYRGIGVKVLLE